MNTQTQILKYTLFNDRSEFEGEIETVKANMLQKGDFATEWRRDKDNKLPVFFEIKTIGPLGVHKRAYYYSDKGPSIIPIREDQEVCRILIKKDKVIYETGATTHVVNDLILFTDNTMRIAERRDEIYKKYITPSPKLKDWFLSMQKEFEKVLCPYAMHQYRVEFGEESSKHTHNMGQSEHEQFGELYAKDFYNWKSEHGYK